MKHTIDQIFEGLNCLTSRQHHCAECPFNPHPGMEWPYGCTKGQNDIVQDTVALLKARVPRVMKLEEVQKLASIRDGAIWLESGAGLMPAFMEFAMQSITFFIAVPLSNYRQFFENDWYGKTWRCWTQRPTDVQRKAAKWDG